MTMTKGERSELMSLIRRREKVMKAEADERATAMLAEFEQQISAIYDFDSDAVWKKAVTEASAAVEKARQDIRDRCEHLGIPREFAPRISFDWHGRGANMVEQRRVELRLAAKARIAALQAEAKKKIERHALAAQEELLSLATLSEAATTFIGALPNIDALMPSITAMAIRAEVEAKRDSGESYLRAVYIPDQMPRSHDDE